MNSTADLPTWTSPLVKFDYDNNTRDTAELKCVSALIKIYFIFANYNIYLTHFVVNAG
jgi:hypothetical protein